MLYQACGHVAACLRLRNGKLSAWTEAANAATANSTLKCMMDSGTEKVSEVSTMNVKMKEGKEFAGTKALGLD